MSTSEVRRKAIEGSDKYFTYTTVDKSCSTLRFPTYQYIPLIQFSAPLSQTISQLRCSRGEDFFSICSSSLGEKSHAYQRPDTNHYCCIVVSSSMGGRGRRCSARHRRGAWDFSEFSSALAAASSPLVKTSLSSSSFPNTVRIMSTQQVNQKLNIHAMNYEQEPKIRLEDAFDSLRMGQVIRIPVSKTQATRNMHGSQNSLTNVPMARPSASPFANLHTHVLLTLHPTSFSPLPKI